MLSASERLPVSTDFVQSPVGVAFFHVHVLVVAVDGCNGKYLVGTKTHYDRGMAGRHHRVIIVRIS